MKMISIDIIQTYSPSKEIMEQVLNDKHDGTCWSCRKPLKNHSLEELKKCYSKSWTF